MVNYCAAAVAVANATAVPGKTRTLCNRVFCIVSNIGFVDMCYLVQSKMRCFTRIHGVYIYVCRCVLYVQ